jgi:hypothetical protein
LQDWGGKRPILRWGNGVCPSRRRKFLAILVFNADLRRAECLARLAPTLVKGGAKPTHRYQSGVGEPIGDLAWFGDDLRGTEPSPAFNGE